MDSHMIKGQNLSGGQGDPPTTGTSLAVRQFCAAAFGWVPVHSPSQPWRVVQVIADQRYCLHCFGEHTFDVVIGQRRTVWYCRSCGDEVMYG